MAAMIDFLDGLPEIEPSGWSSPTDNMKTGTPNQAQGSVSHTDKAGGRSHVSRDATTKFDTSPEKSSVDVNPEGLVQAQPGTQTPAAVWIRSDLQSTSVPNPHQRQLRPRPPKPAPARQNIVVPKFNTKPTSKSKGKDAKADKTVPKNTLLVTLRVPPSKRRRVETPSAAPTRRRNSRQVTPSAPGLDEIVVKTASSLPLRSVWLDGISPKSILPAVATAECPKVVDVFPLESSWTSPSWSEIYPLLPSSTFGSHHTILQHNLWSEKDEQLLRGRSWSRNDELTLLNTIHPSEVLVAHTIKRLYSCRLQDLFRYGLRRPLHPTPSFWTSLLHLLPHPYFISSLAILRYALQTAILYRFPMGSHTTPLMPPYSGSEPGFLTFLREAQSKYPVGSSAWETRAEEIVQVAEFRCRIQVHAHITSGRSYMGTQDKHDLASILGYRAPSKPALVPTELGVSEVEKHLFFLTQWDLDTLADCLDEIEIRDRIIQESKKPPTEAAGCSPLSPCSSISEAWVVPAGDDLMHTDHFINKKDHVGTKPGTVMRTFNKYWTDLPQESKGSTEAYRQEYLVERRLELLAERREAVIRSRIDPSWGQSKQQFGLRHTNPVSEVELLDVPPFDPNPNFREFEDLYDLLNLRVIKGNWLTPATKSWFWEHAARFSWDPPTLPP
ncbi:hypothetical protein DL546_007810 [Coniochaeta pulveracea]|uniref:Uncharacterized protein n=1 Tax=Coniochaeta pulveracea TaxID=177199 RepID=A0A420YKE0_9PEZI|nr:hypothetical protein DL546_007810 [Coniochaeta pulveracea]